MFPEDDVRAKFWYFVRDQAIDPRNDDEQRRLSTSLAELEHARYLTHFWLADEETRRTMHYPESSLEPRVYATLQEAFLAFLVNQAALNELTYTYETWLRSVALILADAQREPDWLRVLARTIDQTGEVDDQVQQHTMIISDDWDCLRRETFDHVLGTHLGRG